MTEHDSLSSAFGALTLSSTPYADFYTKRPKAENDAANNRRETFLTTLYDMALPADAPEQLCRLHGGWKKAVDSLCPAPFVSVKVTHFGGRSKNYDFQFDYIGADGATVHTQKAEFKHGASSVEKQPQFLSLAAKDLRFPVSYAEFYYDRFLSAYCAIDSEITVAPPDRETYLKSVNSNNYDSHPFFRCLYDREENFKVAKKALVNASIKVYLEHLTALMTAKQDGKAFLMWDMSEFHVGWLTAENLTPITHLGVHKGNTILLGTATHMLKLLLRWKNHKGVMYPAWLIGLG